MPNIAAFKSKTLFAGVALGTAALGVLGAVTLGHGQQARAAAPTETAKTELPLPPPSGDVGFVLTAIAPVFRPGDEQCPNGLVNSLKQNYLLTLPAAERDRLLLKANEPELERRWKSYADGPNGTNICSNMLTFDQTGRATAKMLQGKIAPGMNLDGTMDGSATAETCAHQKFVGENGEQGIDNQAYRALGCTLYYRNVDGKQGELITYLNEKLVDGQHTTVLLLRGVKSFVNSDNVEVILASSSDMAITDTNRTVLTNASFTVSDNPRWRNVFHGRIVNGVLITDQADILLSQRWGQGGARGAKAEYNIHKARLRLTFAPDGTLDGLMGGYAPTETLVQSTILGGGGAATVGGNDCIATWKALQATADGLKDPKTGKCKGTSVANHVHAVPAFVFDRAPAKDGKTVAAR